MGIRRLPPNQGLTIQETLTRPNSACNLQMYNNSSAPPRSTAMRACGAIGGQCLGRQVPLAPTCTWAAVAPNSRDNLGPLGCYGPLAPLERWWRLCVAVLAETLVIFDAPLVVENLNVAPVHMAREKG